MQPGGHLEPTDTTLVDAAVCESREETGIDPSQASSLKSRTDGSRSRRQAVSIAASAACSVKPSLTGQSHSGVHVAGIEQHLSTVLASNFWADLERRHPCIDSLRLFGRDQHGLEGEVDLEDDPQGLLLDQGSVGGVCGAVSAPAAGAADVVGVEVVRTCAR